MTAEATTRSGPRATPALPTMASQARGGRGAWPSTAAGSSSHRRHTWAASICAGSSSAREALCSASVAQTKQQIRAALDAAGARPRHRFGQNFMIDANLVRAVADAGELTPGALAIEVGPGTGTLTEELLARAGRAGRVVAVEIDRDLAAGLRRAFADEPRFALVEGDALANKHTLNPDLRATIDAARAAGLSPRLVANLPYNIATPLVIELLIAGVEVQAFTVQKEVADRLASPPGLKSYGPVSVIAQTLADVEVLRTLPPTAFWPAPTIDSALVRLRRKPAPPVADPAAFGRFVQTIFQQRRKTLRKAAAPAGVTEALLDKLDLDPKIRPDALAPDQYVGLWHALEQCA